jgi:hypothetical protein
MPKADGSTMKKRTNGTVPTIVPTKTWNACRRSRGSSSVNAECASASRPSTR